jgi:hypothetical protein
MNCPLCELEAKHHRTVDGIDYFDCPHCDFLFADREFLALVDRGEAPRKYDENYWRAELASSRERSFGGSVARFAEAVLYCRVPIKTYVDIGTGPGYLLEALQHQLPSSCDRFFGVEKFPGPDTAVARLKYPENYIVGALGDTNRTFELGTCIEVLEHLTPSMAWDLALQMRNVSVPGSLFLFNTALAEFVRNDAQAYIDPYRRGHITCWSIAAANKVFGALGFRVHALEGKRWAFVLEYGLPDAGKILADRVWHALPENVQLVKDPVTGSVMHVLGIESSRAYTLEHRYRSAIKSKAT